VNRVLNGGRFETLSIKTAVVEFKDICKLRPDTWLNDEVRSVDFELTDSEGQGV
jgi:hypothetical protein